MDIVTPGSESRAPLLLAAAAALSLAWVHDAAAQAGSTGGSIGKQGKSVSGDESSPAPAQPQRQGPAPRPASPKRQAAQPPSNCPSLAGTWSWFTNGDVVFRADGTAEQTNGFTARWSCAGGMYTVSWNSIPATDRLTLSSDGTRLSGTNNWGLTVTGMRK